MGVIRGVQFLVCPYCSSLKPLRSHTIASYKVYQGDDYVKLKCKSCNHFIKIYFVGGFHYEEGQGL